MFLADLPPKPPAVAPAARKLSQDDAAALQAEARADFFSGDHEGFLAKQRLLLDSGYYLQVPIRFERFPYIPNDVPASIRYGCITE